MNAEFVDLLFGDRKGFAAVAFGGRPYRDDRGRYAHRDWTEVRYAWPDERDTLHRDVQQAIAAGPVDVYVCPALRLTDARNGLGSGKGTNAAPPAVLWADCDQPPDPAKLSKLLGSSVFSGSDDHQHVYVFLDRSIPVVDQRVLNKALAKYLDADDKWSDESLLRLPGTFNHKSDPPAPVHVGIGGTDVHRWPAGELAELLEVDLTGAPHQSAGNASSVEAEPAPNPLPAAVQRALDSTDVDDRSEAHHRLVGACRSAGLTLGQAITVCEDFKPSQLKYSDKIPEEVTRSWEKCEPPAQDKPASRTLLEMAIDTERAKRRAREILDAEDAPALQWWSISELLSSPSPEALIDNFLYLNSLARIFGKPGCGKTFVSLDMCLHVVTGRQWRGHDVKQGPVVYVMAEGQAVNRDRIQAWLTDHNVAAEELDGRFVAVPHAVLLTPMAMKDFLAKVTQLRAVMVVLDTKNAMQVGEENSATDAATMRRALDMVRTATNACVALIDHSGHGDSDRARGSSAVTAAMDTEIRVTKDGDDITVTVTRDKAAAPDTTVDLTLWPVPPSAVLRKGRGQADSGSGWREYPLPIELLNYSGPGESHVPTMARYMAVHASDNVGLSRAELFSALNLGKPGAARSAWAHLIEKKWITPAEGVQAPTGRHTWRRLRVAMPMLEDAPC